jgi:hypothetical protein
MELVLLKFTNDVVEAYEEDDRGLLQLLHRAAAFQPRAKTEESLFPLGIHDEGSTVVKLCYFKSIVSATTALASMNLDVALLNIP